MLIENGCLNINLVQLVRMQGFAVPPEPPPIVVNELLQGEWVKAKDGVFRAELGGRMPTQEEMALLRKLGAAAIPMTFNSDYSGTLVLGATLKAVTRRLHFLLSEWHEFTRRDDWNQKDSFVPAYFLGSNRPLDLKQEMPVHIAAILEETGAKFNSAFKDEAEWDDWPKTEISMMHRVCCWLADGELARAWCVPICAPDTQKPDGSWRPANTVETVKVWLKQAKPGHYRILSSQPFCEGQLMAVRRAVKEAGVEGYTFDVCGPAAPPLPLSRWLDNLAKQLWEEVQLLES